MALIGEDPVPGPTVEDSKAEEFEYGAISLAEDDGMPDEAVPVENGTAIVSVMDSVEVIVVVGLLVVVIPLDVKDSDAEDSVLTGELVLLIVEADDEGV